MLTAPVTGGGRRESRTLGVSELGIGMILESDVLSAKGIRLVPKGVEITFSLLGRLSTIASGVGVGGAHSGVRVGAGNKGTFMEKSKLLLVDDEPNLTSALVRSLDRSQFEIFTADSAQQGLMILAGNEIDVVVSDERMPGMSGSQFLSEMSMAQHDSHDPLGSGGSGKPRCAPSTKARCTASCSNPAIPRNCR